MAESLFEDEIVAIGHAHNIFGDENKEAKKNIDVSLCCFSLLFNIAIFHGISYQFFFARVAYYCFFSICIDFGCL